MTVNRGSGISPDDVVLVTGATGFTGGELVNQLLRTGCKLRAIARPSERIASLREKGVEVFEGNVYDPAVVREATRGIHYLFHVAAAFRVEEADDDVYRLVHVESTRLLAENALAQPGFRRFLHVSTIGVHGHVVNPPATEDAPFDPGDIYQRTKLEGELWIREFAEQKGLPLTVIRPAMIYGPGDLRLLKLFRMAKLPVIPLFGKTRGLMHLIHVEDLARAMIVAVTSPRALGEVYICAGATSSSQKEVTATIARHLGRQPRYLRLPVGPLMLAASLCEAICKPLGISPPLYRRRVGFFIKDRAFDGGKLFRELDFQCKWDNRSGIESTTDWYTANGFL